MIDDDTARRVLRTWAFDAEAFARVLATIDPVWRSEVHDVAGGRLVLCGAGLYVNRALAAGVDEPLTRDDVALIIDRGTALRVPPACEVSPFTRSDSTVRLGRAGFAHDREDDVTVLIRPVPGQPVDAPADVVVRTVRESEDLALWKATSALGWGHDSPIGRQASDAFTDAAHAVDGEGMVLAFDREDGRPLGCASTTIRDGIATLGGMSTVPTERRRGVQAALLRHRLALAAARGCTLAASTAAAGGASERNLIRHGFEPQFTLETWIRPLAPAR